MSRSRFCLALFRGWALVLSVISRGDGWRPTVSASAATRDRTDSPWTRFVFYRRETLTACNVASVCGNQYASVSCFPSPITMDLMFEAMLQCHGRRVDHSTSGWMTSCDEKSLFFVIGS